MNPEQTKRALDLFKVAFPLEGGERARILDEACGTDEELRGEVEGMLLEQERLEPLLGPVPADRARMVVSAIAADLPLPSRLGQYTISRLLGEGGMGLVYEAVQAVPHRRVALKVLRPGALSTEHRRRFEQEVEALGRLRHPGIAQIFEGGTLPLESGHYPFLAMELVDGVDILEHSERGELSVDQRFELLARVADAVQHAHERGVVHRDLKPENILVDGTGQPKILDFGVARFTDHEVRKTLTRSGELVGTIAFMSPEQLLGDPAAVTAASDVYALGVLAYELLVGRLPIALDGHPVPEAIRLAQVSEPELLGALDPRLRGDPEAIVAKALEKDLRRRYRSAGGLADDIRRALRHEPIQARRPTVLYQLRKLARRHRGVVAAVGAVLLSLSVGLVLVARSSERARESADRANRQLYRTAISAANYALNLQDVATARAHLETAGDGARGWEWHYVNRQLEPWLFDFETGPEPIGYPAYLPSRLVALALNDGTVALCEPDLGRLVRILEAGTPLSTLARTQPPGRVVAGTEDGQVLIWDLETGKRAAASTGLSGPVRDMDVSPDGTVVAIAGGRAVLLGPGEEPRWFEELNCGVWNPGVVFSPDGTRIATLEFVPGQQAGYTANVGLWDVSSGRRLALLEWGGDPHCLAFSPDGSLLAVGNRQRDVLLVDGETLAPVADMLGHFSAVYSLAFVPDGTKLVSTSSDGSLRIWSVEERRTVNVLRHGWTRSLLALDPNGKCVTAVGMEGGGARAWSLGSVGPTVLRGHESYVYSVEFSPQGDLVASAGFRDLDRSVRLWDPIQGTLVGLLPDASAGSWSVFSSDGRKLVLRPQESGHPRTVDILTGQVASHDHSEEGSPEGFMRGVPGEAWLECFRDQVGSAIQARVGQTVFSPVDDLVVSRIDEQAIVISRGIGGPQLARLEGAELDRNPDLSPDGRLVAAGSADHAVYVWDWQEGGEPMLLKGHTGQVYDVRFSPDGKRLASGGNDNRVILWDTETWESVLELLGHESYVYRLAWSPDGTQLASASGDHTVRLWDSVSPSVRHRQLVDARLASEAVRPKVEAVWAESTDSEAAATAVVEGAMFTAEERDVAERVLLEMRLGGKARSR